MGMVFLGPNSIGSVYGPSGYLFKSSDKKTIIGKPSKESFIGSRHTLRLTV